MTFIIFHITLIHIYIKFIKIHINPLKHPGLKLMSGLCVDLHAADFSLSVGCFGTDIIQKCTKWYQIGVYGLNIGQIFAKFQCASFLIRKMLKKNNMVGENAKM